MLQNIRQHKFKILILLVVCLAVVFGLLILINYLVISSYGKHILSTPNDNSLVGIVPGGGVDGDIPRPLLKDRLDVAASLLKSGKVRKLVLSGDNRYEGYNEPRAMYSYLVKEKRIDPDKLQQDNAGRSTYETCERAAKIFGLKKALIISESTHLPRVIFLCRSFGIETYGYKSDGQSSAGKKVGQRFREIMARTKAGINVYLVGEKTVLGDKIEI